MYIFFRQSSSQTKGFRSTLLTLASSIGCSQNNRRFHQCHYMCPIRKLFDLLSYFLSFIYRIQRNRVCWFCLIWTDDSSIPYPHPGRTVGKCVVKMMKFRAVEFLSSRKILTMPKFAVNRYIFYVSRYFQCIFNFFYFGTGWGWGGDCGCFTPPQPP